MSTQQQQVADLQRGTAVLESELQLALLALKRAERLHAQELSRAEASSNKAMQDATAMIEKLHAIQSTEDAVREFYVQLKCR